MQTRPSSSSGESLPDYAAFDGTAPPAYSLDEYPNSPARPKAAHTHSSRDKATVPTPNPPLVNDHIHMQNGLNFDVEANIAAANVS